MKLLGKVQEFKIENVGNAVEAFSQTYFNSTQLTTKLKTVRRTKTTFNPNKKKYTFTFSHFVFLSP